MQRRMLRMYGKDDTAGTSPVESERVCTKWSTVCTAGHTMCLQERALVLGVLLGCTGRSLGVCTPLATMVLLHCKSA